MKAPPLLSVAELAQVLRKGRATVYRMVASGELPFEPVKGCGITQFRRTDVEAWLGCDIQLEDLQL